MVPDLFHPQHDMSKATALALAGRVRQAAEGYEKAVRTREQLIAKREAYRNERHGPGRPPDFAGRIERARATVKEAQQAVDEALDDQEACREAIRGLSTDYHCYRLADGVAQRADQVEALIAARFTVIDEVAERAKLSQKCLTKIDKARRVTSDMVATISFVHTEIAIRLASLDISVELRTEIAMKWVPGLYLQRVAARAKLAEVRRAITETAKLSSLLRRMPQLARPARPRSKRPYRAPRKAAS